MTPNEIYQELIRLGVPPNDARILVATAKSESGLNPTIRGDSGNSIGLFQIHMPSHWDKLTNFTGSAEPNNWIDWLSNPLNNIKAGVAVYNSQGLGAWTEYNNGHYEKYLNLVDSSDLPNTVNDADFLTDYNEKFLWNKPFATSGGSYGGRGDEKPPSFLDSLNSKFTWKNPGVNFETNTGETDIYKKIMIGVFIFAIVVFLGAITLNLLKGVGLEND